MKEIRMNFTIYLGQHQEETKVLQTSSPFLLLKVKRVSFYYPRVKRKNYDYKGVLFPNKKLFRTWSRKR